ncbi:hypothetical protein BDM02DRAFT_3216155 [Thelephora ganbajun]|uniref:Uncharacterized protein n=1 Tax=Thelephora ganbajun TaxID=370292 RepID=A0ACB6ZWH6_THEGA|nr:hypothetical protein BDM02DRAFT_3216155 [Thelephora ganbajun]
MLVETITCSPTASYPYHIAAKRYSAHHGGCITEWWYDERDKDLTLIFLHSTSFPKEIWEPTIEGLLQGRDRWKTRIREAYAIDCPNHGVAAVLNDGLLDNCAGMANRHEIFLLTGPTHSTPVDFSKRNLIGIGHSLGGVSAILMQAMRSPIKFMSVILVEPMLDARPGNDYEQLRTRLVRSAYKRKDVWSNREEAAAYFRNTVRWHPRIHDIFIKYGLRDHPTHAHEVSPFDGVTLACTRDQEALMYRDKDGATAPVQDLNAICSQVPVHVIFGENPDYLPRTVQDRLTDPKSGRRFASMTRIPNTGHLVSDMSICSVTR